MKKFFKLFAVALVAGAMFTACGDDPITPDGGETPDTPTPYEPTNTVKVTFDGNSWNAAPDYQAVYVTKDNATKMQIIAGKDAGLDFRKTDVVRIAGNAKVGTVESVIDPTTLQYTNGILVADLFHGGALIMQGQNGPIPMGTWWAKSLTLNVTEFDATEMTTAFTVKAVMFDGYEAFVDEEASEENPEGHTHVGVEAAPTANMDVEVSVKLVEQA